jgi:hypothetical protein
MALFNHNIMAGEDITDLEYIERFKIDKKHAHNESINHEIANAVAKESYQMEYEAAIVSGQNANDAEKWAKKVSDKGLADAKKHIRLALKDRKKNNISYPVTG